MALQSISVLVSFHILHTHTFFLSYFSSVVWFFFFNSLNPEITCYLGSSEPGGALSSFHHAHAGRKKAITIRRSCEPRLLLSIDRQLYNRYQQSKDILKKMKHFHTSRYVHTCKMRNKSGVVHESWWTSQSCEASSPFSNFKPPPPLSLLLFAWRPCISRERFFFFSFSFEKRKKKKKMKIPGRYIEEEPSMSLALSFFSSHPYM